MEPLYKVGDVVFLKDSCEVDIGTDAWLNYVNKHRQATVKFVQDSAAYCGYYKSGTMYAVEFYEDFKGGHSCHERTLKNRGQYVHEAHLELANFEASREVNTVPNLEGYDGEDTKENNL
jgi:hypothetical protein